MLRREPRLARIERDAIAAYRPGPSDWPAWNGITRQLRSLIGWFGCHPEMRSNDFYDAAAKHLEHCFMWGELPDSPAKLPTGPWDDPPPTSSRPVHQSSHTTNPNLN